MNPSMRWGADRWKIDGKAEERASNTAWVKFWRRRGRRTDWYQTGGVMSGDENVQGAMMDKGIGVRREKKMKKG